MDICSTSNASMTLKPNPEIFEICGSRGSKQEASVGDTWGGGGEEAVPSSLGDKGDYEYTVLKAHSRE